MYYAPAFRSALQRTSRTMKQYKVLPYPVQKNMQAEILSSLHEHCVCFYRKMFGKKSEDETEEERTKQWSTVYEILRKWSLEPTLVHAKLPSYFRLEFDLIETPIESPIPN
jgi:hypothetical protein